MKKYRDMETVEKAVAKSLMDIKAVMLRPENPFTWASGWNSPIYCDNRKILSYPEIRENVCRWMADIIKEKYPEVEVIAGVATGAIAHGYLVAHILGKPFCYVRPKPKDHGTGSQIEGILPQGAKVVIVEDLISTGMSSLAANNALVQAGADVMGMVAIFTYNFNKARQAFEDANVELTTLSNYDTLIEVAAETGYVKESEIAVLKEWRVSPSTWGK
jgi:orotate phosphoribosyltransferase